MGSGEVIYLGSLEFRTMPPVFSVDPLTQRTRARMRTLAPVHSFLFVSAVLNSLMTASMFL